MVGIDCERGSIGCERGSQSLLDLESIRGTVARACREGCQLWNILSLRNCLLMEGRRILV